MNRDDIQAILEDYPLLEFPPGERIDPPGNCEAAFYVIFHTPDRPAEIGRIVFGRPSRIITVEMDRDEADAPNSYYQSGESTAYAPGHEEGNGFVQSIDLEGYLREEIQRAANWMPVALRDARDARQYARKRREIERQSIRREQRMTAAYGLACVLCMLYLFSRCV